MSSCERSVTTETGTFYFRNEELTRCQAKEACKRDGQILAPVTNSRDLEALNGVAESYNWSCGIRVHEYYIGLDIEICGGVQTRLFTNDVLYKKCDHDHLFEWHGHPTKNINQAVYFPALKKMFIGKSLTGKVKNRFICLKQNSTSARSAQPLTEEAHHQNFDLFLLAGAVMVALVSIVLMLKFKKGEDYEKKENKNFKNQIEVLKNEIERLKN